MDSVPKPKRKLTEEARIMNQTKDSVIYFTDDPDILPENYFLSADFPCDIRIGDRLFSSVEQAMNWENMQLMSEIYPVSEPLIRMSQTALMQLIEPAKMFDQFTIFYKHCGDSENFMNRLKDQYRNTKKNSQESLYRRMKYIHGIKFAQNPHLADKLLKTGDRPIRFKRGRFDVHSADPSYVSKAWFIDHHGGIHNGYLGDLLMEIRELIRSHQTKEKKNLDADTDDQELYDTIAEICPCVSDFPHQDAIKRKKIE